MALLTHKHLVNASSRLAGADKNSGQLRNK
ncbi:unnamed protein product, partial [Allacma fusca]